MLLEDALREKRFARSPRDTCGRFVEIGPTEIHDDAGPVAHRLEHREPVGAGFLHGAEALLALAQLLGSNAPGLLDERGLARDLAPLPRTLEHGANHVRY